MKIVGIKSFYWRSVGTRRYEFLRDSLLRYRRFRVKQYGLSSVKKNEVFRVYQYGLSFVKKNELGYAGIGKKIVVVRGWTDSELILRSCKLLTRAKTVSFPTPLALQHTVLTNQINHTYINGF